MSYSTYEFYLYKGRLNNIAIYPDGTIVYYKKGDVNGINIDTDKGHRVNGPDEIQISSGLGYCYLVYLHYRYSATYICPNTVCYFRPSNIFYIGWIFYRVS